ncbi:hypothetical protein [Streptomyces sp. NPDC057494]|uniref:hypothetical protein n=1 Tax=Streptomyces sp. NPDC057494 TaxID=3346148 RepID=UPI0036776905
MNEELFIREYTALAAGQRSAFRRSRGVRIRELNRMLTQARQGQPVAVEAAGPAPLVCPGGLRRTHGVGRERHSFRNVVRGCTVTTTTTTVGRSVTTVTMTVTTTF